MCLSVCTTSSSWDFGFLFVIFVSFRVKKRAEDRTFTGKFIIWTLYWLIGQRMTVLNNTCNVVQLPSGPVDVEEVIKTYYYKCWHQKYCSSVFFLKTKFLPHQVWKNYNIILMKRIITSLTSCDDGEQIRKWQSSTYVTWFCMKNNPCWYKTHNTTNSDALIWHVTTDIENNINIKCTYTID